MSVLKIPVWPEVQGEVSMTFLHGEAGWYLWMLHRPDPDLTRIERDLMLLFNNGDLKDFPAEVNPETGIYVCTLAENRIIRGLILNKYKNVGPEEGSVIILDVDSGRVLNVPKDNMKVLPTFASKAPARAVRCDLGLDCKERFDWPPQIDSMLARVLCDAEMLVSFEAQRPGSIPTVSVNARLWNSALGVATDFRQWLCQHFGQFLAVSSLNGYIPEPVFNNNPTEPINQSQSERPKTEKAPTVSPDFVRPTVWNPYAEQYVPSSVCPQIGPPPGFGPLPGFNPQAIFNHQASFNPVTALMLNQGFAYPPLPWTTMWPNLAENYPAAETYHTPPPPSLPNDMGAQDKSQGMTSDQRSPLPEVPKKTSKTSQTESYTEAVARSNSPVLTLESLLEGSPELGKKLTKKDVTSSLTVDSFLEAPATAHTTFKPASTGRKSSPKTNIKAGSERSANHESRGSVIVQAGRNHVTLQEMKRDWRIGTVVHVIMSDVTSPEQFAANVVDGNAKDFCRLQKDMLDYTGSVPLGVTSKKEAFELLGNFCVCYSDEDKTWFRAEVVEWAFDDPDQPVEVWSVDYGGLFEIPLAWIRRLDGYSAEAPIQCTSFSMHNVRPRRPLFATEWPEEHCAEFRQLMPIDEQYWLQIEKPMSDGIWPVSVYKNRDCLPPSLNTILVEKKLAFYHNSLPEPNQPSIKAIPSRAEWDPMRDDFDRGGRDYLYDDEDACLAVSGYKPSDEKNVCRFFRERGTCPKGLNCRQRHVKLPQGGYPLEQKEVYNSAFNDLDLPEEGSVFTMKITKIKNVHHFFGLRIPDIVSSNEEHYQMLFKKMNQPEEVRNFEFCRTAPAIGQIVLARESSKGYWFRGRVIDVDHDCDDKFEVRNVDTGVIKGVERKDLREMDPAYLHLPFQALECFLAGMAPVIKGPEFAKEAVAFVTDLVRNPTVKVYVVSTTVEEALEVKVSLSRGRDAWGEEDLATILLRKGYVQRGPRRITSKEVCRYRPG